MERVQYMIYEDLFIIVAHASAGNFQICGDSHRFVDSEKGVKVIILQDVTAHFLRVSTRAF